jgi:hypothetical protein
MSGNSKEFSIFVRGILLSVGGGIGSGRSRGCFVIERFHYGFSVSILSYHFDTSLRCIEALGTKLKKASAVLVVADEFLKRHLLGLHFADELLELSECVFKRKV